MFRRVLGEQRMVWVSVIKYSVLCTGCSICLGTCDFGRNGLAAGQDGGTFQIKSTQPKSASRCNNLYSLRCNDYQMILEYSTKVATLDITLIASSRVISQPSDDALWMEDPLKAAIHLQEEKIPQCSTSLQLVMLRQKERERVRELSSSAVRVLEFGSRSVSEP